MSTQDKVDELKRLVGVTDREPDDDVEPEVKVAELLAERDAATARLRAQIEKIERDYNAELDELNDGRVYISPEGYAYRILREGIVAKVAIEDAHLLMTPKGSGRGLSVNNGYISLVISNYGMRRQVRPLSHVVLPPPPGMFVDHINAQRADNRRSNLRVATRTQNLANIRVVRSKSGYKGVYLTGGMYSAQLTIDNRTISLGRYNTAEEAARRYDEEMRRVHGEFAATNESLGLLPKRELEGYTT